MKPKKIVFIGRYTEGSTGIVRSIFLGLIENGHQVYEINLTSQPSLIYNPHRMQGGHGPVYVKWDQVSQQIVSFKPDIILFCAGGLTFSEPIMKKLRNSCTVIGITLSDPDVFPTVSKYAHFFEYHTTNSIQAYDQYKRLGITNTLYMPFGIDSRFFVPFPSTPRYKSDISIIGHYRPNRLPIAKKLREKFNIKIFGRHWPIPSEGPVYDEEWFKAMYSTDIIINFPTTGAGYTNVKVGVFEAIATGRLLITEYFDEMKSFFQYDKEIIGYHELNDLIQKIEYFKQNKEKATAIGRAGQLRCAKEHTWKKRLEELFNKIPLSSPNKNWNNFLS